VEFRGPRPFFPAPPGGVRHPPVMPSPPHHCCLCSCCLTNLKGHTPPPTPGGPPSNLVRRTWRAPPGYPLLSCAYVVTWGSLFNVPFLFVVEILESFFSAHASFCSFFLCSLHASLPPAAFFLFVPPVTPATLHKHRQQPNRPTWLKVALHLFSTRRYCTLPPVLHPSRFQLFSQRPVPALHFTPLLSVPPPVFTRHIGRAA